MDRHVLCRPAMTQKKAPKTKLRLAKKALRKLDEREAEQAGGGLIYNGSRLGTLSFECNTIAGCELSTVKMTVQHNQAQRRQQGGSR